jgi:beta-1,4-mannosyl-glycoprotein beta-1,4-N-acetylglucosaminyltransferase
LRIAGCVTIQWWNYVQLNHPKTEERLFLYTERVGFVCLIASAGTQSMGCREKRHPPQKLRWRDHRRQSEETVIIDAFMFFNEADLLEIRLNELDPVVDWFVIVESLQTFSGKTRAALLPEIWDTVKPFEHKIKYQVLSRLLPEYRKSWNKSKIIWPREHFQRNALLEAALEIPATHDDILMISDCDEIPRMTTLRDNLGELTRGIHTLEMDLFYYSVNNRLSYWNGTTIGRIAEIRESGGPAAIRERNGKGNIVIKNGGWHFSYFGGPEHMKTKVESFSHSSERRFKKFLKKDPQEILSDIVSRRDVVGRDFPSREHWHSDDPRLPGHFLNNPHRYAHFTEEFYKRSPLVSSQT